jgi:hypothetical protein
LAFQFSKFCDLFAATEFLDMWDHFTRDAGVFLKLELLFMQGAAVADAAVGVAILFLPFSVLLLPIFSQLDR